ncbi:hypothetical protein [Gilvimarinus chinensis]|uniref:hypothetical protein n=1 Tax=Gilvimarinus chinensis TaxID=396005 RepID=UPI0003823BAE|nr:hypothetical protein [Gilvimarinus chinensis]
MSDLEYEQMLERERAVANQVNEMLGKPKNLSPLEKVTAERDQLRTELEKERERVSQISTEIHNLEYAAFNLCESVDEAEIKNVVESTCPERSLRIAIRNIKSVLSAGEGANQ